jgi:hypothetical protein
VLSPMDERSHDPERAPSANWQIERIDPDEGRNPRVVYGVPLLLFLALLLIGALAGMLMVPLINAADAANPVFSLMTPAHLFVLSLLLLCAIPLAWGLVAAVRRLTTPDPWVQIEALCHRREVQPVPGEYDADAYYGYSYRLLCRFEYDGLAYDVTPEGTAEPEPRLFTTREAAWDFLKQYLLEDGRTQLWINTRNPLEAHLTAPPE